MSIFRFPTSWGADVLDHSVLCLFWSGNPYSDCGIGGHPVEKRLMDHTALRPFGTSAALCCDAMNRRLKCLPSSPGRSRRGSPPTKISDRRWESALLRMGRQCPFMVAGWICARRAFTISWAPVSGASRMSEARGGCHEGRSAARVAHHSIGDAMSYQQATDYSQTAPAEISGVSLLPVPSSAGDNRPYISNLAGKLADAPFSLSTVGGEP
jgi:hypothetical protein